MMTPLRPKAAKRRTPRKPNLPTLTPIRNVRSSKAVIATAISVAAAAGATVSALTVNAARAKPPRRVTTAANGASRVNPARLASSVNRVASARKRAKALQARGQSRRFWDQIDRVEKGAPEGALFCFTTYRLLVGGLGGAARRFSR